MKSYELLDLIGEAGEDYVLAADDGEPRPRSRWRNWTAAAACAACAALVLLSWPALQSGTKGANLNGDSTQILEDAGLTLHAYTVVEGGEGLFKPESVENGTTAGGADDSAPESIALPGPIAGGEPAPYSESNAASEDFQAAAAPFAAPAGDVSADAAGGSDPAPEPDTGAPAPDLLTINQGAAIAQYQRLCRTCGVDSSPPEWYAGAWLDNDYENQECRLAVSIVAGYHTPELEAQIQDWCGGPVLFVQDMKYPYARLLDMLEQINQALAAHLNQDDVWDTLTSIRPDMEGNYLEVDFSGLPSDEALAFLADLDPEGDAIWVQAFTGSIGLDTAGDLVIAAEPTPTPIAGDLPQPK